MPNLIQANMVKPGATVIDVGITRITNEEGKTKLVGDVDYDGESYFLFMDILLMKSTIHLMTYISDLCWYHL